MTVDRRKIDAFLKGELKGEELIRFQEQLASNDELAEALSEASIIQHGRVELKNKLDSIHKDYEQNKGSKRLDQKWYLVAAVLIVLITIYLLVPKKYSNDELYTAYFEIAQPASIYRGDDKQTKSSDLMLLFQKGDYEQYILEYEQLRIKEQTEKELFYLAQCHLALDSPNFESAIIVLNQVIQSEGSYKVQGLWYSGLVYVKQNKKQKAVDRLRQLINVSDYKKEEARELIQQLSWE